MLTQRAPDQRRLVVLLVLLALLLVVLVGVLVWGGDSADGRTSAHSVARETDPTGLLDGAFLPGATGGQGAPSGFDPSTAPVVPAYMTPYEYVRAYHEACAAGEYGRAFALLPRATQGIYGSVEAFAETLEAYSITAHSVDPPVEAADTVTVVGWQEARGLSFGHEWRFVRDEEGRWLLHSRVGIGVR